MTNQLAFNLLRRSLSPLFMVVLLITFARHSHGQESLSYDDLDTYIGKYVTEYGMPGLAVGVIKNDEVVFLKGYGVRNTASDEPVDKETVFGIASCSKAFTAACLAILVDEGRIGWDDRVVDHYPDFRLYDPYITSELKVRDLLCHRAGFETFDGDLLWYGTDYSREEIISRIRYRKNIYSLREEFGYSNIMYIVAGEVIRVVSGKTWDEFVMERIITPLGMSNTTTSNQGFGEGMNIAWPHLDGAPMEFLSYDNAGPAASINTSASDLLRWVQLMLNKGRWQDTLLFSENEYYNLVKPLIPMNAGRADRVNGTHFSSYGLGWSMKDYKGMKVIDHGGGLPGFHSKVVFVPEDSLGYVILANEISLLIPALEKDLLDFHLNDSIGWAARYLPYKAMQKEREQKKWQEIDTQRKNNTVPSLELQQYAGLYEDKMYGKAEIRMEDNAIYLVMLPSGELLQGKLDHWHYDTFRIRVGDPFLPEGFVTFSLDESGEAEGFRINIENPDFHFYKLDFKRLEE